MIYGERIRLRGVEREDLPKFVEWLNDPEVRAHLSIYLPLSMEEEKKWFEGLAQRRPEERPLGIEVRSGKGWKLVGNCGLFGIEWNNRAAEFGIFIGDKSVWGKGYGTDAARLVLRHGFETLNLNRIFLRVYEDNPRAMHTYEKAGFVPEGRMRQAAYRNGEYKDVLLMSTLRSEWDSSKG